MRIVYMGTGDIGIPSLKYLAAKSGHDIVCVVSQPDKPSGRGLQVQPTPIKEAANALGLPVFQPAKIKTQDAVDALLEFSADVFVVCAYGQILPKAILDMPQLACLNIHASLLPRYRGAAPIQAAIKNGDAKTGITIMWMDEGLDTGDILMQSTCDIAADETAETLHDRLADMAPSALAEALVLISGGAAPKTAQNHAEAVCVPRLKKEDGLVDWSQTAGAVSCHIRSMTPWPGAYTWIRMGESPPKRLKFFSPVILQGARGEAGRILEAGGDSLCVACADGALLFREVQMEGKKRMLASDFLRGFKGDISGCITEVPKLGA